MQKITAKNSWSLPLIDHIDALVGGGGGARKGPASTPGPLGGRRGPVGSPSSPSGGGDADSLTTNFQKASCALDASIKIYACRVDDVYSSSFRVLESLSSNANGAGEGDGEGGAGEGGRSRAAKTDGGASDEEAEGSGGRTARKGPARSLLLGASSTLETNLANITLPLSAALAATDGGAEGGGAALQSGGSGGSVDPVFQRLVAGYDDAGLAGLLLNRLAPSVSAAGAWSGPAFLLADVPSLAAAAAAAPSTAQSALAAPAWLCAEEARAWCAAGDAGEGAAEGECRMDEGADDGAVAHGGVSLASLSQPAPLSLLACRSVALPLASLLRLSGAAAGADAARRLEAPPSLLALHSSLDRLAPPSAAAAAASVPRVDVCPPPAAPALAAVVEALLDMDVGHAATEDYFMRPSEMAGGDPYDDGDHGDSGGDGGFPLASARSPSAAAPTPLKEGPAPAIYAGTLSALSTLGLDEAVREFVGPLTTGAGLRGEDGGADDDEAFADYGDESENGAGGDRALDDANNAGAASRADGMFRLLLARGVSSGPPALDSKGTARIANRAWSFDRAVASGGAATAESGPATNRTAAKKDKRKPDAATAVQEVLNFLRASELLAGSEAFARGKVSQAAMKRSKSTGSVQADAEQWPASALAKIAAAGVKQHLVPACLRPIACGSASASLSPTGMALASLLSLPSGGVGTYALALAPLLSHPRAGTAVADVHIATIHPLEQTTGTGNWPCSWSSAMATLATYARSARTTNSATPWTSRKAPLSRMAGLSSGFDGPGSMAGSALAFDASNDDDFDNAGPSDAFDGDDFSGDSRGLTALAAFVPSEEAGGVGSESSPADSSQSMPQLGDSGDAPGGEVPLQSMDDVRRVERIRVKYETVAKKVDVHLLKSKVLTMLDETPLPHIAHSSIERAFAAASSQGETQGVSRRNAERMNEAVAFDTALSKGMSFKSAVSTLAPAMPEGVTIPFYFITLLHLANEHDFVLSKTGSGAQDPELDLLDFRIARLTTKA
jgi:hypothetical protein